jgi:hypothetical protein
MPHNAIFGVPNHIILIIALPIVVVAGAAWWLIDRRK